MNVSASLERELRDRFPGIRAEQSLARYTSSRIGGPAEWLLEVYSADELASAVAWIWEQKVRFRILGGGSNILISDDGLKGITLINRARKLEFIDEQKSAKVIADSGANLGVIARQAATLGMSGLEWAAGIPGSLGAAIVGNAGAHGGEIADVIIQAQVLHRVEGLRAHLADDLAFDYRTSKLKSQLGEILILSAELRLGKDGIDTIREKMNIYLEHRKESQPPGASMGSMFKNPENDFAGRLVEQVGLKGKKIGQAQISPLHGNFFLNLGGAKAKDVHALIMLAKDEVREKIGIELELEIALLGEW